MPTLPNPQSSPVTVLEDVTYNVFTPGPKLRKVVLQVNFSQNYDNYSYQHNFGNPNFIVHFKSPLNLIDASTFTGYGVSSVDDNTIVFANVGNQINATCILLG